MHIDLFAKSFMISAFCKSARRYCSSLPEGIQYYGFTYYPRHKDFKDPPYTPTKLLLVKRTKPFTNTTKEEKDVLLRLNIDGTDKNKEKITIVKNIPQINALLWKVKHLVEIKPVKWSGDLPNDFSGAYLRETGELVISPRLRVSDESMQKSEEQENSHLRMKKIYLKKVLRDRWNKGEYNV